MISAATAAQLQRVADGLGVLALLKLTHPSWAAAVCVVNDTRELITLGDTYIGLPFSVKLPNDKAKEAPRLDLQMDNVGRDLTAAFELLPPGATLMGTLRVVSRATPAVVDWEFSAPVGNVQADVLKISAQMGWDQVMRRAAVRLRFDDTTAPALFPD